MPCCYLLDHKWLVVGSSNCSPIFRRRKDLVPFAVGRKFVRYLLSVLNPDMEWSSAEDLNLLNPQIACMVFWMYPNLSVGGKRGLQCSRGGTMICLHSRFGSWQGFRDLQVRHLTCRDVCESLKLEAHYTKSIKLYSQRRQLHQVT